MNSTVTVIIPVYNREKEIVRSVESVLRQDFKADIVIVDDGSTDNTPVICDEYAAKYDNITVVHTVNGGVSQARNTGIDNVKTEYFMFLDSDDELSDCAISKLHEVATKTNADMVVARYQIRSFEGEILGEAKLPERLDDKIVSEEEFWEIANYPGVFLGVTVTTKLFRTKIWDGIRFPLGIRNHEDEYMIHRYVQNCNIIYSLNAITYIQHQHEVGKGLTLGEFDYDNLFGSRCRIDRFNYLMDKKFYAAALDTFGFGTRILLDGDKKLSDEKSRMEISDLYAEYKKLGRRLKPHVNTANKIRLDLFCINLRLYGKVREMLR
jgi:glycosyltransferase involved in cell wall biosynthesis